MNVSEFMSAGLFRKWPCSANQPSFMSLICILISFFHLRSQISYLTWRLSVLLQAWVKVEAFKKFQFFNEWGLTLVTIQDLDLVKFLPLNFHFGEWTLPPYSSRAQLSSNTFVWVSGTECFDCLALSHYIENNLCALSSGSQSLKLQIKACLQKP